MGTLGMDPYMGLVGIAVIFGIAFAMSNDRRAIDRRLVVNGICLQVIFAVFILKTPWGEASFAVLGNAVEKLLSFASHGTSFILGPLNDAGKMTELFGPAGSFIFVFKVIPTLIFVSALSALAYHIGLMQRVVGFIAHVINRVMGASGSEATSNAASVLIGMLEAQLLIKPFLSRATQSELMAILAGSMACISGGIMAVYIQMGIAAEFMMAASMMAIAGALVIAKIVYPETAESMTRGGLKLGVEKSAVNVLDAISIGAVDGLKVGVAASAVLLAVIAFIALVDFGISKAGLALADVLYDAATDAKVMNVDLRALSLSSVLSAVFYYPALLMGVPVQDAAVVGGLMGSKLMVNEFVAYSQMAPLIENGVLSAKSELIATFALCGFANFGSVAILIGGVGGMAPERKHDLARLGLRAMVCGTLASYLSATLAGVMHTESSATVDGSLLGPLSIIVAASSIILLFNRKRRGVTQHFEH
jgi:concentrative nucleoside transporter, CNT family